MTHVIPQTVRSVSVIDFILAASEIFKIIGSATCFFNNSGERPESLILQRDESGDL